MAENEQLLNAQAAARRMTVTGFFAPWVEAQADAMDAAVRGACPAGRPEREAALAARDARTTVCLRADSAEAAANTPAVAARPELPAPRDADEAARATASPGPASAEYVE